MKNVKLFLYLSLLTVSLLSAAEQAPEHTLATLAARLQALELENKSLRESQLTASSIGAFVGTRMNDYARKTDEGGSVVREVRDNAGNKVVRVDGLTASLVAYAKADDDGGVVVRTGDFEKLLRTALGLPEVDAVGAASADSSVQLLAELKNRLKQKDVEAKEKALKKPEKKK